MIKLNSSKKGAELPLNAIVIALLVIIVLVVIIAFFLGKFGEFGSDLSNSGSGLKDCSVGSYAISSDRYQNAKSVDLDDSGKVTNADAIKSEDGKSWNRIYTIPVTDNQACYALEK